MSEGRRFRCVLALPMASGSAAQDACVARGTVTSFAWGLRFVQTDGRQFDVMVDAALLLPGAHAEAEFAYLGSGLLQVGRRCLFLSPA